MPKFKLISEHINEDFEVEFRTTSEFEAEQLDDVLMHIDMFLKGVGYVYDGEIYPTGSLEVSETEYKPNYGASSTGCDDQFMVHPDDCCGTCVKTDIQHSDFYFDINRNR